MQNRLKAVAAGGAAAAVLSIGALIGIAQAQPSEQTPGATATATATATPRPDKQQRQAQMQQRVDEYVNRLAQNLGVSPDKLKDAVKQTALQEVDAAQSRGDITAQQAQAMKDRINQAASGGGFFFGPGGFGPGKFGPGGIRGRAEMGVHVGNDKLAGFLTIPEDQFRAELNGKSLAQVAQAHGKTADQLKQFITDTARQALADQVSKGNLTQQQADQILQRLTNNLDNMINRVHNEGQRGQRPQRSTTN